MPYVVTNLLGPVQLQQIHDSFRRVVSKFYSISTHILKDVQTCVRSCAMLFCFRLSYRLMLRLASQALIQQTFMDNQKVALFCSSNLHGSSCTIVCFLCICKSCAGVLQLSCIITAMPENHKRMDLSALLQCKVPTPRQSSVSLIHALICAIDCYDFCSHTRGLSECLVASRQRTAADLHKVCAQHI